VHTPAPIAVASLPSSWKPMLELKMISSSESTRSITLVARVEPLMMMIEEEEEEAGDG
jgi:hypothetical protein